MNKKLDAIIDELTEKLDKMKYYDHSPFDKNEISKLIESLTRINNNFSDALADAWDNGFQEGEKQ